MNNLNGEISIKIYKFYFHLNRKFNNLVKDFILINKYLFF